MLSKSSALSWVGIKTTPPMTRVEKKRILNFSPLLAPKDRVYENIVVYQVKFICLFHWIDKAPKFCSRDCTEKNETDIFFYIPKMVASRVKPQARDQNDWSIALKWGIVHLCSSYIFKVMLFCKELIKLNTKFCPLFFLIR